jgi:O-antigen/teichoic acid export membrane protein
MLSKVAASVADQGVASATNFLLNIFLARWLLPREYGAYSVCWSVLLVMAGFHNALILEPMSVVGPAEYQGRLNPYLFTNSRLNWLVILLLAMITFIAGFAYCQDTVRVALFVLAACVPGYLLLLVARRQQYVLNQPVRALRLSVICSCLVFVLIWIARATGRLSALTALAAFGMACSFGVWFGALWFAAMAGSKAAGALVPMSEIARQHWRYGKWLFASALLAMGTPDVQTILLSTLVDLKSAGALRALMNFVLPLSQLLTVLSIYALPRLASRSKRWGTHRVLKQGILFPAAITAITGVYLAVLTGFAPQLERLLYGGKMQSYVQWVPLLAASALISGVGWSFSTLLRAVQESRHQFIAGITGSAVGIACAFYLLRRMGFPGALWSMLAANTSSALVIAGSYLWLLKNTSKRVTV